MQKAARVTLWTVSMIVMVPSVLLALSASRYWREMALDPASGVDESGYVRIGGIDQWVQIRGEDRHNPILLWLNGGPGFPTIPSTWLTRPWERYFTVVMWDQRGEGKTFEKAGPAGSGSMTVEQMTQDGIELAAYVGGRLHQDKVILFGHSWGTILGARMAMQRPDLFSAYVATSQVTKTVSSAIAAYPRLVERARTLGNHAAEQQLADVGPPPYDRLDKYWIWLTWANVLDAGRRPLPRDAGVLWALVENVLGDRRASAGARFSQRVMFAAVMHTDVPALGYQYRVPVLMIEGSEDLVTVAGQAKEYFDTIVAPHKDFVLLQGDGHSAAARDRHVFLATLVTHLHPWLARPDWPKPN